MMESCASFRASRFGGGVGRRLLSGSRQLRRATMGFGAIGSVLTAPLTARR